MVQKTSDQEVHALDIAEDVLVLQSEHIEKVSQSVPPFAINAEILVFVKSPINVFIYLDSIALSQAVIHLRLEIVEVLDIL